MEGCTDSYSTRRPATILCPGRTRKPQVRPCTRTTGPPSVAHLDWVKVRHSPFKMHWSPSGPQE